MDHIQLLRSVNRDVMEGCVYVFTETWLPDSILDSFVKLEQFPCHRSDRVLVNRGKNKGGVVCVYISDA